jgi:type VI secretion system secreted protein Hcp
MAEENTQELNEQIGTLDYYLKIDTIEGEIEAKGFEKQMQIRAFQFHARQPGKSNVGTGAAAGKVGFGDFEFSIISGKASPQLFLATCKGNHIPQAILTLRKTGGDGSPYTYERYIFKDIIISSFECKGGAIKDFDSVEAPLKPVEVIPLNKIKFNFTELTHEYSQQKADGTVALSNTVAYNIKSVEGTGA